MNGFSFPLRDRVRFYAVYFFSKFFGIWYEVKRPKLRMFLYELLYTTGRLFRFQVGRSPLFNISAVDTRFGRFQVRPNTMDLACVSPAFERTDIDELIRLLDRLKAEKKAISFLDIGTDFGTYTVTAGNVLKDYQDGRIYSFEPVKSSYSLLVGNIRLNGLEHKAETFNCALSDKAGKLDFFYDTSSPGSSGLGRDATRPGMDVMTVDVKPLDSFLDQCRFARTVVIKMDVEGFESTVMAGATKTLAGREVYLLVEDFVNEEIVGYLQRHGFVFVKKLSPYNSWWHKDAT